MRRTLLVIACLFLLAAPARAGTYGFALYRTELDRFLSPAGPIPSRSIDVVRDYYTGADGWTGPRLRARTGGAHDAASHVSIELLAPGAGTFVSDAVEAAVRVCSNDAAGGWWGGLTLSDSVNTSRFLLLNVPAASGCVAATAARATGAVSGARVLRVQLGARSAGTRQQAGTWLNVRSVKGMINDDAPPRVSATADVAGAALRVGWQADDLESGPRAVQIVVSGPGGFTRAVTAWGGDVASPQTGCLSGQWVTACATSRSGATEIPLAGLTGDYAVSVTATDGVGNAAATTASARATFPPSAVTGPYLAGAAQVGRTVTVVGDTWANAPETVQFAFYRVDGAIRTLISPPADAPGYVLQRSDYGAIIVGQAIARNAAGTASADTPASGPVRATAPAGGAPVVSGLPATVDVTLAVLPGSWDNGGAPGQPLVTGVRWFSCAGDGCALRSAEPAYAPGAGDVGRRIRADVTVANDGGTATASTPESGPVLPGTPTVAQAPAITGDARVGATLAAWEGVWDGHGAPVAMTIDWLSCDAAGGDCAPVGSGPALAVGEALLGRRIRVRATAGNGTGTAIALSSPTAPVVPANVCVEQGPGRVTVCVGDGRITLRASAGPRRVLAGRRVVVSGRIEAAGTLQRPRTVTVQLAPPDPYAAYARARRVRVGPAGAFRIRLRPLIAARVTVTADVAGSAAAIVLSLPGVRVRPHIAVRFSVRPDLYGRVRDLRFSGSLRPSVGLDHLRLLLRGRLPDGTEVGLICRVSEQPVVHRGRFGGGCRSRGLPRRARFRVTFLAGPGSPLDTSSSPWRLAQLR